MKLKQLRPFGPVRVLLLFGCVHRLAGQAGPASTLSIPWIMRGFEIIGKAPTDPRWTPDGQWIYFHWLAAGAVWNQPQRLYRVRAEGGAVPELLSAVQADSAGPWLAAGPSSPDRAFRAVSHNGDLYLIALPSGTAKRLTETTAIETPLTFDRDGKRLFFSRDNNVFALELGSGAVRQLTDIRPGPAPDSAKKADGQRGFVETEQRRLIGAVEDQIGRDSIARAEREALAAGKAKPMNLDRDEVVVDLVPAPTGRKVLVLTAGKSEEKTVKIPQYVTRSGYTEEHESRSKVGDRRTKQRVGLLDVASGKMQWVHPLPNDSANVFAALFSLGWNDAGSSALLWALTRDYTTRHVLRLDAESAQVSSVDVLRDTAWVDGPCSGCGGWLPGDRGVWLVSEADGWAHLYTMDAEGGHRVQRTRGKWEVLQAELTPDRTHFALHTSEVSPFERHFSLLPLDGGQGGGERLTRAAGGHAIVLSPDRRWMADLFSVANRPPELFLQAARAGAAASQITTSPSPDWMQRTWIKPEIVWVLASDGVRVPARVYRPKDFGATSNGAGVIFVHGAGYLHNVHNYWSSYFREYMFHHLLAAKGYVVLDLDYRGSAGYGRDWRTAIYRHMGGRDLQDQVDGSKYLQQNFGVAPEHIGIYGGSYGGFITLMALFTEGKSFGAGAALRSVTDWAHYNHSYTAAILNEPQDDSLAYRQSSPIYFAEGLNRPLLMAHGMVDDNVHFQDIVRLTQRLIELGKKNWELAVYPVEDHGFLRPDSWADEYRRIYELFERHLKAAAVPE